MYSWSRRSEGLATRNAASLAHFPGFFFFPPPAIGRAAEKRKNWEWGSNVGK
jgi:hypothetical protein